MLLVLCAWYLLIKTDLGHDVVYFFYTLSKVPRVMGTIHDVHAHFIHTEQTALGQ